MLDKAAFAEDCRRAAIIVTPLWAPQGCAASLIIDRDRLAETGAVTLKEEGDRWQMTTAHDPDEDRPWSPAPKRRWQAPVPVKADQPGNEPDAESTEPDDSSPE